MQTATQLQVASCSICAANVEETHTSCSKPMVRQNNRFIGSMDLIVLLVRTFRLSFGNARLDCSHCLVGYMAHFTASLHRFSKVKVVPLICILLLSLSPFCLSRSCSGIASTLLCCSYLAFATRRLVLPDLLFQSPLHEMMVMLLLVLSTRAASKCPIPVPSLVLIWSDHGAQKHVQRLIRIRAGVLGIQDSKEAFISGVTS